MVQKSTVPDSPPNLGGPQAEIAEIERATDLLFEPGSVIEVRIPKTRAGVVAGYFDSWPAMVSAIRHADSKYKASGIYYVLNRVTPVLLGRAYNRPGRVRSAHNRGITTSFSGDGCWLIWTPSDCGYFSSDEEHAAAIQRARTIADDMTGKWGDR